MDRAHAPRHAKIRPSRVPTPTPASFNFTASTRDFEKIYAHCCDNICITTLDAGRNTTPWQSLLSDGAGLL